MLRKEATEPCRDLVLTTPTASFVKLDTPENTRSTFHFLIILAPGRLDWFCRFLAREVFTMLSPSSSGGFVGDLVHNPWVAPTQPIVAASVGELEDDFDDADEDDFDDDFDDDFEEEDDLEE